MRTTGFGWEITNISNNGANAYMPFNAPVTITGLDLDVAFMTLSPENGWAEVLADVMLSVGPPNPMPGPSVFYSGPAFGQDSMGGMKFDNPVGLQIGGGSSGPGFISTVILKCYCNGGGSDVRHVSLTNLSITVPAKTCLVFHMDHMGVPGDVEMQGVVFYQ